MEAAGGDQCSQKSQWFCSSTFPFPFWNSPFPHSPSGILLSPFSFWSFIPSGNRRGLVGTDDMSLIPKFGHLCGGELGYCSSFESQIHGHVGVEGQNLGTLCIRDCRSPEITRKRRMGTIKSALQWAGKQQQQNHWDPGVCFRLPWKCLFSWVFLLNLGWT